MTSQPQGESASVYRGQREKLEGALELLGEAIREDAQKISGYFSESSLFG
jgi:hypothetical protein